MKCKAIGYVAAAALAASPALAEPLRLRPETLTLLNRQPVTLAQLSCPNTVEQAFPLSGPEQTRWRICWREQASNGDHPAGLVLGPIYFRTAPGKPFVKIVHEMQLGEIFVPYHPGSPRYYDLGSYGFTLTGLNATDCSGAFGTIQAGNHVCVETGDRGLMYKDDTGASRRGQRLAIWAVTGAANYNYVARYEFRDDGFIIGTLSATGANISSMPHEPHSHNGIWRIDTDIGSPTNRVALFEHHEDPSDATGKASDTSKPITAAQGIIWSPAEFTAVEVSNNAVKNAQGNTASYDLMLLPEGGVTRHREAFARADYWVTPYHPDEIVPDVYGNDMAGLPTYIKDQKSLVDADSVLWVRATVHHHPRDEDGVIANGQWVGTAHLMTAGWMLMPHNLFDCAPFFHNTCP